MILVDKEADVLVSESFSETTFSIEEENLHIILDILRSKVYKNNIGAICREVACNSRDAQRENGDFTTPIEIEISDKRNSLLYEDGLNIIFRDKGVGISPERVVNIYTKYGASTKRTTNEQTGGFGLGAKTPFSYSDAFIVRTIISNIEYVYSIYIDATKKGKMALLFQDNVEPQNNLTEIIIPVKQADLIRFENEVIKTTHFWDVRPKLINFKNDYIILPQFSKNNLSQLSRKDKFMIYKTSSFLESSVNVIIDGIYYPVDTKIVNLNLGSEFAICLFYNNGELNISANRETLQYDDDTIKSIRDNVNVVIDELKKGYEIVLHKCVNLYNAKILFLKLKREDSVFLMLTNTYNFGYTLPDGSNFNLNKNMLNSGGTVDIYWMNYSSYDNRTVKTPIDNIYLPELLKYENDMYWIDRESNLLKNNRLSGPINRAIIKKNKQEGFIVFIEKSEEKYKEDSYNAFSGMELEKRFIENKDAYKKYLQNVVGLDIKTYWDVEPDKIKIIRAKKENIVMRTYQNGSYTRDLSYYFIDGYFHSKDSKGDFVKIDNIIFYHLDEEKRIPPEEKDFLLQVSIVCGNIEKGTRILMSSKLKSKYFVNYESVEKFLVRNNTEFKKYYERWALKTHIVNISNFNYHNLPFEQNIKDDINYMLKLKSVVLLEFSDIMTLIRTRIPNFDLKINLFENTFDTIEKTYPLIDALHGQSVNNYVQLVNERNRYKALLEQNSIQI